MFCDSIIDVSDWSRVAVKPLWREDHPFLLLLIVNFSLSWASRRFQIKNLLQNVQLKNSGCLQGKASRAVDRFPRSTRTSPYCRTKCETIEFSLCNYWRLSTLSIHLIQCRIIEFCSGSLPFILPGCRLRLCDKQNQIEIQICADFFSENRLTSNHRFIKLPDVSLLSNFALIPFLYCWSSVHSKGFPTAK